MINKNLLGDAQQEIHKCLCQNEHLVKMYSEAGILRRIKKYIKDIRTNEEDGGNLGWCEPTKPEIVICSPKNEKMLEITEITEDTRKFETLIHEAIHAILKNKNGTGLLKINYKKSDKQEPLTFKEIGRGINEGYTNWIAQNSGVCTTTYEVLTSINNQIEACIGKKKMMEFSKGNYNKLFKALNMKEAYGIEFLRQLDDVYNREKLLGEIELIKDYIQIKIHNLQKENKITKEDIGKEIKARKIVDKIPLYKIIFDEDINQILLDLNNEGKIKIYEKRLSIAEQYKARTLQTLGMVINNVERKILKSLIIGRMDSPTTTNEFQNVIRLMEEMKNSLDTYKSELPEFNALRERIEEIGKELLKNIYLEVENLIKTKSFTGEMLQTEYIKICRIFNNDEWSRIEMSGKLANFIGSKSPYPEENKTLIKYALDTETTDIIDSFSIQLTESGKGIIYQDGTIRAIVKKDELIYCDNYNRILEKDEDFLNKIDWIQDETTDYNKLKQEFEKLKKQKTQENPNYQIQITNGIIAFIDGEDCEFYDIIEGESPQITEATLLTKKPIKPMIDSEYKAKIKKENFINKIKRFINKKNQKHVQVIPIEQKENRTKKFRERLKTNPNKKYKKTESNKNRNFDSKEK